MAHPVVSARTFAKSAGVSRQTVLNWIKRGKIKATNRPSLGISLDQLKKIKP